MIQPLISRTLDTWRGLDKWVKRFAILGTAVTLASSFTGRILAVTLDERYALAGDVGKYVTKAELFAQAQQLNQQIGELQKGQLQNERRRLRDELYRLKEGNRPADRRQILKLEDDLKDIERDLRELRRGR